jgi:serine-type D-Ala-D-Ala endopeptidase (penicillin-binding protein 7)
MSSLHALPFLSRIPWASRVDSLTRILLMLLLVGPLTLTGAACVGSQPNSTQDWQRPAQPAPEVGRADRAVPEQAPLDQLSRDWEHEDGSAQAWGGLDRSALHLQSDSALIVDEHGNRLYSKNPRKGNPIASITKLMTAMVVLDTGVSLKTPIRIIEDDRDRLRNSRSRLRVGEAVLPRGEMMMVALMSSDNRAAHALGRTTFVGGTADFVKAMNRKARALGMRDTVYADPTGLNAQNRSTAEDLLKMVRAASTYAFIRNTTSRGEMTVSPFANQAPLQYRNTNPLVRDPNWVVELSKTGFINEAGHCLVMRTRVANRSVFMVFLDAEGKHGCMSDSGRVRDWLLAGNQTASR